MTRVKIYGAGSIGNHLAHASRTLGWEVSVSDVSPDALTRMRTEIYPARYGAWDNTIQLTTVDQAPRGGFDYILIGTPPEHHLSLALSALEERARAVLIEKPVCPPSLLHARELLRRSADSATRCYVGYDHVVGAAACRVVELLKEGAIGELLTMDVEFREHWGGIFAAHPWLSGPADSYLGFWERGGGASGEHSHALNLWQHFAHAAGAGRVTEVDARLRFVRDDAVWYDDLCMFHLCTEHGFVGRVVQDVITRPHRKWAHLQGATGAIEWICNYDSTGDAVVLRRPGMVDDLTVLAKRRPDDFIRELTHLEADLEQPATTSPLRLERGLDTMLVVAAAIASDRQGQRARIDYNRGHQLDAIVTGKTGPCPGTES